MLINELTIFDSFVSNKSDSIIQIRLSNAIRSLSFRYPYIYLLLDLGLEDLAGQTTILSF